MNTFKLFEAVAVLLYGVMSILGAMLFAAIFLNPWGLALAVAAAGATYVFQALQFDDEDYPDSVMGVALLAPVLLTVASVIVTLAGA